MTELITGIVDNAIVAGFSPKRYSIIFTTGRIIVALAETSSQALSTPNSGGNANSLRKAAFDYAKQQADKLRNMNPDDILNLDKSNFSIGNNNLLKIEIAKGNRWHGTTMKLFTTDNKIYTYALAVNEFAGNLFAGIDEGLFEKYMNTVKSAVKDKLIVK